MQEPDAAENAGTSGRMSGRPVAPATMWIIGPSFIKWAAKHAGKKTFWEEFKFLFCNKKLIGGKGGA